MAKKKNTELVPMDFHDRCMEIEISKRIDLCDTIIYEFEKLLDCDSPLVFYDNDRGYCINTEIAMNNLRRICDTI